MDIVISSGHGLHIRGASGPEPWGLDEVDEARKVVEEVAKSLRLLGVGVTTYHDDVSDDQSENLNRIVDFHNSKVRDLDVSIHFNAYEPVDKPMGCEVLYVSQDVLAEDLSAVMADTAGFINRGPKYRGDLFFLNNTEAPSVLVETCFVDSKADIEAYHDKFSQLCDVIAETLAGEQLQDDIDRRPPERVIDTTHTVQFEGTCSHFGGPDDMGVSPSEGLAFIFDVDMAPTLFLPEQPAGTTGLARRLDPEKFYVACRWDYDITSKDMLADQSLVAIVRAKATGRTYPARPADWGPHEEKTGRAADLSPGLMAALGIETDDEVEVLYPAPLVLVDSLRKLMQ